MKTTYEQPAVAELEEFDNSEVEYDEYELEDSSTSTDSAAYGNHLVPLQAAGDFDLPLLLAQQLDPSELPDRNDWEKWGRVNRSTKSIAWHHYASDAKFTTLLRDPDKLINTGAKFSTEITTSTFEEDPLPVALANLWRRRCTTRIFQDAGIKTFVDLHTSGIARSLLFEGVPREHQLYCTRYKLHDLSGDYLGLEAVEEDYAYVLDHVGEDVQPIFLVYGAPASSQLECEKRGWYWLPNAAAKVRNSGGKG